MARLRRRRPRGDSADPAVDALVADLVAALGRRGVHAEGLDRALYGKDASLLRGDAAVACFPTTTDEVRACVQAALRHGRPFVPRGSGTGLAGGAVPLDGAVVIVTTRMNRVLEVDLDDRVAWVQPGVLNLDLSRQLAAHGVHFAPDPSSQQSCSIGGNVANNSGGPHCLRYGVTSAHVVAVEVVLPDGSVSVLGGVDPEPAGYDLRGAFVGGEGCLGIATRIAVRLTPNPPAVRTMLLGFADAEAAADMVSAVIAAGLVPAALEMMDADITRVVEEFVHAGYPLDAAAVLLVELDGLPGGVDDAVALVRALAESHGATSVRLAADDQERALLWKGRKNAFGAIARLMPDYYLHDTVVPRTRLTEVLREVSAIGQRHGLLIANVFHAGDGNLHPLIGFDARTPGELERVHRAGAEIVEASLAAGGVLSGEHGIGLEKRGFMDRLFSADDLDAQACLRAVFDPEGVANPGKVLPAGASCGEVQRLGALPEGTWV